jgi:ribosomal protein S12 methylthiotransferase accessory factor
VAATILDCTVDTNVPTYSAYVHNRIDEGLAVCKGSGSHLDAEIAILRAITEALQGRLNFIAGARDDIFRSAYRRIKRSDTVRYLEALDREAQETAFSGIRPSRATQSFEGDVYVLLQRLIAANLEHVIVVDLTPDDFPIHVVRVVVSGLEGYMHFGYRPGRRALSYGIGTPE